MADSPSTATAPRQPFTVTTVLVPLLTRPAVAKLIKYSVYAALVVNFGLYLQDDYLAYRAALGPDAPWPEIFEQFSTTIDTAAWLGLVFLFELETYVLSDDAFDGWLPTLLLMCRLVCYVSIGYAAYGYTAETLDYYDVSQLEVSSACELADRQVSMQLNAIDYTEITADNCSALTRDRRFYRVNSEVSVLAESTLRQVRWLGWIDVLNALVWLLVVFLIEVELWLQSADRFSSRPLTLTRQVNTVFYAILMGNGIIWLASGYLLYAWDAFLWIFGFWAIELNLAEWEQDRVAELRAADGQLP